MGAPIKSIRLPEGIIIINFVDNKIWAFRPSSSQYEGAYVVGNTYTSDPSSSISDEASVTEPTPAN